MYLATYAVKGGTRSGIVLGGGRVLDFAAAEQVLGAEHPLRQAAAGGRDLAGLLESGVDLRYLEDLYAASGELPENSFLDVAELELVAPIPRPGKVVCIGLNTEGLVGAGVPPIEEMPTAAPFWFYKATTAVIGSGESIIHPGRWHTERLIPEPELGLIISRRCGPGIATPRAEDAAGYIAGYVVCNDVSALDLEFERGGDPFAFNLAWSKSYPTFGPIGPWMVTTEDFNPTDAAVTLRVNGETVVASNTRNYLWNAWELLEYFAAVMVMEPGDVISCGNFPPTRVVWPGDLVEIEIEKIGTLRNPVAGSAQETRYRVPPKVTKQAAEFKALRARESARTAH